MSNLEFLTNCWHHLMERLNLSSTQFILDDLIKRYNEPHRVYHNLKHIESLLKLLPEEAGLELATWFHDAIYDPQQNDNEEQSATLAKQQLGLLGVSQAQIARVSELILASKTHRASDAAMALFIDADLSILGAQPSAYNTYARGIRQEYTWVSEADYRLGRSKVLHGFIKRQRIFQTDIFQPLEAQARANIERELNSL